jgi:hypothetical protein
MLNIEALSLCESPDQIRSEAGRLSRLMGFEYWVYCEEGTAYGPTWPLQNLPTEAWLAYADYCARKENPLVEHFRKEVTPSAWLLDDVLAADPLRLRCLPDMAAHFKELHLDAGHLPRRGARRLARHSTFGRVFLQISARVLPHVLAGCETPRRAALKPKRSRMPGLGRQR